jgi:hypothetical protein
MQVTIFVWDGLNEQSVTPELGRKTITVADLTQARLEAYNYQRELRGERAAFTYEDGQGNKREEWLPRRYFGKNGLMAIGMQQMTTAYTRFARRHNHYVATVRTMSVLARAAVASYRIEVLGEDPELVKLTWGDGQYPQIAQ